MSRNIKLYGSSMCSWLLIKLRCKTCNFYPSDSALCVCERAFIDCKLSQFKLFTKKNHPTNRKDISACILCESFDHLYFLLFNLILMIVIINHKILVTYPENSWQERCSRFTYFKLSGVKIVNGLTFLDIKLFQTPAHNTSATN